VWLAMGEASGRAALQQLSGKIRAARKNRADGGGLSNRGGSFDYRLERSEWAIKGPARAP
jgi:hypothetical protein